MNKKPKIASLVYGFEDELLAGDCCCGPDPDYAASMDKVVSVDLDICTVNHNDASPSEEERDAWLSFRDAIESASKLIGIYKHNAALFQKMARQHDCPDDSPYSRFPWP